MDGQARAGIDIYGTVLRYAEVERHGAGYRLLRLGSCDFDFDVAQDLLRTDAPTHLDVVTEALGEVFAGSAASQLHVALHPPDCYTFFSALPVGLPEAVRRQRLQQEALLLGATGEGAPLRFSEDALHQEEGDAEGRAEWFHVLALPEQTWMRFDRLMRSSTFRTRYRLGMSTQGAAQAVGHIERTAEHASRPPLTLAIGWYPDHVEYVLCREGQWYFSHYTPASAPTDCAYFAVALLERLKLPTTAIGRIFIYGVRAAMSGFASLQAIFRQAPERLNPVRLVDLDPDSLADSFDAEAYAPCIGLAL
jgi:hypothetical protein